MIFYADGVQYYVKLHQSDRSLPYLFMLHGFMGSGDAFHHLIPQLTDFCNPITVDLIGHGKTDTPDNPELFSADHQIHQIRSILNRLQFNNLFAYGYSMGGRLLFQLATSTPTLFKGACIESSHCGISDLSEKDERKKADSKRAADIEKNYTEFLDHWQFLPLFASTPKEMKKVYRQIMEGQSPRMMANSLRGFGAGVMPSVCEKLQKLHIPLYLVAGADDQKYVDRMTEISELNNSIELYIADRAGHRVHTDRPDLLINYLKKLISTHV